MKRIAVFPGSFDPITLGHVSVIHRAMGLFDEIIVAIGINSEKKTMFSPEQRCKWIAATFEEYPMVRVETYEGLTVDFCNKREAHYILRGLRTAADFEFERSIGQVNKMMHPDVETIFLLTEPLYTPVSSSVVRDVLRHGGNIEQMVPAVVFDYLQHER